MTAHDERLDRLLLRATPLPPPSPLVDAFASAGAPACSGAFHNSYAAHDITSHSTAIGLADRTAICTRKSCFRPCRDCITTEMSSVS